MHPQKKKKKKSNHKGKIREKKGEKKAAYLTFSKNALTSFIPTRF